jgi:hypothetical protein
VLSQNRDVTRLSYSPAIDDESVITTWMSKIYYGLFYNDYVKLEDSEWRQICESLLSRQNFKMIQNAYARNYGFSLPSSLFVFKSTDTVFDVKTFVDPMVIMIKIKTLIFVLCIEDGFLTKTYLNNSLLNDFKSRLYKEQKCNPDFPIHLYVLAEILALRINIPKTPKFVISNGRILNTSFMTLASNPETLYAINEDELNISRTEILNRLMSH